MDFKVGDKVRRKKGSASIGVIKKIYKEDFYITNADGKKLFASAGDCAINFDNQLENSTITFSPI